DQLDLAARSAQAFGELSLLTDREQEIRGHADHEHALRLHLGEPRLDRGTVLRDAEEITRARQVQIAVRVELARELIRVMLEISLALEHETERIAVGLDRRALAPKAQPPFLGRAVGDHAELAREAHAGERHVVARVVAVLPGRIAP